MQRLKYDTDPGNRLHPRELGQRVSKFAKAEASPLDSTPTKRFYKWWFQIFCFFSARSLILGEDEPNLTSSFQKRWFNHQPETILFCCTPKASIGISHGIFSCTGHNYLWIAFVSLVWTNVLRKWAADNLQGVLFQAWSILSLKNWSVLGFLCVLLV